MSVRLLVVDDHRLVGECLQRLLQDSFEVVDRVEDARSAIALSHLQAPDIIVIGTSVRGFSWLTTLRCLVHAIPSAKILLAAAEKSPTHLEAAFREGARGYILMRSPVSELLAAIGAVLAGGTYITPLTKTVRRRRGIQLTRRQMAVIGLVAAGKTAREIAALLQISEKAVEFHKTALMRDLGLRSSFELIRFAYTDASMLREESSPAVARVGRTSSRPLR
jgi:DNA-binding NarL/FixJ family response regulator